MITLEIFFLLMTLMFIENYLSLPSSLILALILVAEIS